MWTGYFALEIYSCFVNSFMKLNAPYIADVFYEFTRVNSGLVTSSQTVAILNELRTMAATPLCVFVYLPFP